MSHAALVIRQAATAATTRPPLPRVPLISKAAGGLVGDLTLVLFVVLASALLHAHRLPLLAFVFLCLTGLGLFESLGEVHSRTDPEA